MQLTCICFHGQCLKFDYKIHSVLFSLLKRFNLLLGICCLHLVAKHCLDFFYKILPVLGSEFFIQLIKLLLCIYVLQLRNLSVGLKEEPCIGFTQENLMENSLQDLSLLIYLLSWSILQLCYFYPKVHAFTSCSITHLP